MTGATRGTGTSTSASSGGISFLGALLLAFIVLKLAGVIGWSWWWILSPAWIPAGLALLLALFGAALQIAIRYYDRKIERHRRQRAAWRAAGQAIARARAADRAHPYEHGPRRRWGARPVPVYGNCPVHDTVHEMLAYGGRMCEGWEPADPEPGPPL